MSFTERMRRVVEALTSIETLRNREFLQEIKAELFELDAEHQRLAERVATLEQDLRRAFERSALVEELRAEGGLIYRPGNPEPGPYCPQCWTGPRRLVHLVESEAGKRCPSCQRVYPEAS